MAVPIELLRALLAPLAVFFAYMLGRSGARVYREGRGQSRMYGWLVRAVLTVLAATWRHGMDTLVVVLLALAALALAGGVWQELRPRAPDENLTKETFPGER